MNLPEAYIRHSSSNRLRLCIPSRKKDHLFFAEIEKAFKQISGLNDFSTNPDTGSVLFLGSSIVASNIAEVGKTASLFHLIFEKEKFPVPSKPVAATLGLLNKKVEDISRGSLDLWELFFIGLLGFGIIEIARGKFKSPPWYTAFWYAFAIYTKSIIDKASSSRIPSDIE